MFDYILSFSLYSLYKFIEPQRLTQLPTILQVMYDASGIRLHASRQAEVKLEIIYTFFLVNV